MSPTITIISDRIPPWCGLLLVYGPGICNESLSIAPAVDPTSLTEQKLTSSDNSSNRLKQTSYKVRRLKGFPIPGSNSNFLNIDINRISASNFGSTILLLHLGFICHLLCPITRELALATVTNAHFFPHGSTV